MITIRPGSRVYRLLLLLSLGGEFPAASLSLIGKEHDMRKLVHRLESVETFRSDPLGLVYTTKLVQLNGKKGSRTIKLYKGALPILNELHPESHALYMEVFSNHQFRGDREHIERNHRISEALAINMMAGIEIRPYVLPQLQNSLFLNAVPDYPSFYNARGFKKLDESEFNKTMFTRIIGIIFYPGSAYAVYNTRGATMKWNGMGEIKAALHVKDLARMNAGVDDVSSALLLGNSMDTAMQTVLESDKSYKSQLRFDKIYRFLHFIPLDQNGIRLLRMLIVPNWREKMLHYLFIPEMRPRGYGFMEYDAYWEGSYIYSHLDSDIARLIRFREGLNGQTEKFEVLCFPWQVEFIKKYLGQRVIIKQIEMEAMEEALGTVKPNVSNRKR